MREIKFRAWIEHESVMLSNEDLMINNSDFYADWRDWEDGIKLDCVPMQYTGLKDCDGVEIYEGDIFTDEDNKTHVVTFKNGGFGSAGRFLINYYTEESIITHEPLSNSVIDGCKVIGNIHETPELLEEGI